MRKSSIEMIKNLKIIVVFLLILPLSSCQFEDVSIDRVEAVNLKSLKGGVIDGTIELVLTNPNSFAVTVKSGDFVMKNGNVKLGEASLKKKFKIEGNGTKTYPVELTGNLGNALAGGLMGLAGLISGQKPKVTIEGEIRAGNFFFTRKVPVSIQTDLPINL